MPFLGAESALRCVPVHRVAASGRAVPVSEGGLGREGKRPIRAGFS